VEDEPVNIALVADEKRTVVRPKERRPAAAVTDLDDAALVAACRRGERRAMEALYHQYKRRVYGLVTRIVGSSDADEVAQDVFVRIYRGLPRFRGDSQLGTWIYRLAVNAALSHVTRRAKRQTKGEEAMADLAAPSGPRRDPRVAQRLEVALEELPPGYRAVLVLHDVEGLSHEECAAILGCRVGTSKSQLHKARGRMRELLGPELAAERAEQRGEERKP
jgi:RNA polymerase sigma-70 factor (ECF subfamily)